MGYQSSSGALLRRTVVSRGAVFLLVVSRAVCRILECTTDRCNSKLLSVARHGLVRRYCSRLGLGRAVCSYLLLFQDVGCIGSLVLPGGFRMVQLLCALSIRRFQLNY